MRLTEKQVADLRVVLATARMTVEAMGPNNAKAIMAAIVELEKAVEAHENA